MEATAAVQRLANLEV
jgi:hypothetical protein